MSDASAMVRPSMKAAPRPKRQTQTIALSYVYPPFFLHVPDPLNKYIHIEREVEEHIGKTKTLQKGGRLAAFITLQKPQRTTRT